MAGCRRGGPTHGPGNILANPRVGLIFPSRPQIAKLPESPDEDLAELERYYGPDYAKGLYG